MNKQGKGVLLIAVGSPNYGRLAFTLLLSIKNQDADIPVTIIHDETALKDLHEEHMRLFDTTVLVPSDRAKSPSENAFHIKTQLYRLSPYKHSLYIDADCIILPGKSVSAWFEQFKNLRFTACTNAVYDYKTKTASRGDYTFWGEPEKIRAHYKLPKDGKLPQINSSLLYFVECSDTEQLFTCAEEIYNDNTFQSYEYRNVKPDEFAFNVACAKTNVFPHQFPFRPLYFHFQSESLSRPYIQDNYVGLSVISDNEPSDRVLEIYNDLVEYYFTKFGFKEKFFYVHKTVREERPIVGVWHISIMGNWREVVIEQLNLMQHQGLIDVAKEIRVTMVGPKSEAEETMKTLRAISLKFVFHSYHESLSSYEFPAMTAVKQTSKTHEQYYGFYIHTKGVSKPDSEAKKIWRDLLNHYIIRLWRVCVMRLKQGYETVGVNLLSPTSAYPQHYSGNFWWYDSNYVRRLPEVYNLNRKDRYQAEFWLCKGKPTAYNIITHRVNDEQQEWFPKKKIAIFMRVDIGFSRSELLTQSSLLQEAHYSVCDVEVPGFHYVAETAEAWESMMEVYCKANPDAYVLILNGTSTNNDCIEKWRYCYEMLSEYDVVAPRQVVGDSWYRASVFGKPIHNLFNLTL